MEDEREITLQFAKRVKERVERVFGCDGRVTAFSSGHKFVVWCEPEEPETVHVKCEQESDGLQFQVSTCMHFQNCPSAVHGSLDEALSGFQRECEQYAKSLEEAAESWRRWSRGEAKK